MAPEEPELPPDADPGADAAATEVGELRRRLEEALHTLDAIQNGSVNAVVVNGPKGPPIFTLESPDQPLRTFVEGMREGALTPEQRRRRAVRQQSPGAGLGATFTVRLPRVTSAAPSPEEELVIESQLENRLILVIDDDADILELVRYALEHRGARVDTVQTAAAALDRLAMQRDDVLVSDLGLPEKDGLTLMREVRAKSHGLRELRTVALTGYASEADAQLCREAGSELHLVKPISPWELARSITRLLEQPVDKPAAAGAS